MKKLFVPLMLLVTLMAACSKTKEDELAGKICACYQPYAGTEAQMSEPYRQTIYGLFTQKSKSYFKKTYWLGQMEKSMDILNAYDSGYGEKQEAEKQLNVLKAILGWEAKNLRHVPMERSLEIVNTSSVEGYDTIAHQTLSETLERLKHFYTRIYNQSAQKMDEAIMRIIKTEGRSGYEKYRAPEDHDHNMNHFMMGMDSTLFKALEKDPSCLNQELKEQVASRCPGAEKIIF